MCDIETINSVCNIGACLKSIKSVVSTSSSETDIWIVTFNDQTIYGRKSVKRAVMKIYSVHPRMHTTPSLIYEGQVYEITKNLIDAGICPNFLRMLLQGQCSFPNVATMLKRVGIPKKNLVRTMKDIVSSSHSSKNITPLETPYSGPAPAKTDIDRNGVIGIIMTEYVQDSLNLEHFIDGKNIDEDIENREKEIWLIIFQVYVALYTLVLSKTVHNDIHIGNVLVKSVNNNLPKPSYCIEGVYYTLPDTENTALVFDFDRSYAEQNGRNENLETRLCVAYNQCNSLSSTKDFINFSASLFKSLDDHDYGIEPDDIVPLIGQTREGRDTLYEIYSNPYGHWLTQEMGPDQFMAISPEKLTRGMYTPLEIVRNVAGYISEKYPSSILISNSSPDILRYRIWNIKTSYFNLNGSLNIGRVNKDIAKNQKKILERYCSTKNPDAASALIIAQTLPMKIVTIIKKSPRVTRNHGILVKNAISDLEETEY